MTVPAPLIAINEDSIRLLVHGFYDRVRADPALGPVFDTAIAAEDWPAHLQTMCRFWSSVMLASGRYNGNPVAVHRAVSGIAPELFPHWLALFATTAQALFVPAEAAKFIAKAQRIAESLRIAVFFRPGQPPDLGSPACA
ncbi:group III truncated hemoglobin [Limobrevibacterium gyesilva]|uniref:Group III truncated hemoglobin n=1 Tax=Limobrevibacterium gyesilva TaxID=2991712 RepID=A0AA41YTH7_9PROT|nr:group III truncated hemoglobin [Limobrevibacterium gyesilva]MCW3475152.1 group III truncated hemoglobin [Limobrevibacterium gyesilva]